MTAEHTVCRLCCDTVEKDDVEDFSENVTQMLQTLLVGIVSIILNFIPPCSHIGCDLELAELAASRTCSLAAWATIKLLNFLTRLM